MATETYEAIIKIPMGKKPCTFTIDRKGDGTFEGEFTVLGSTAPIHNGKIDDDGNYSCDCAITTFLGTMESVAEGRIHDGLIDGVAKARIGVLPMKSKELW
ncbi:MAG: hypothetical protein Q4C41_09755 [Eggerthellaceae bacterium]|nr:hypothetical protein [Eggerthellaceae bacterium]